MGTTAINLGSGDKLNNSPVSYVTLKEVKNGVAVFTNERNLEYEARLEKEREEYRNIPKEKLDIDFNNIKKATKAICKHLNSNNVSYKYDFIDTFEAINTNNYSIYINDDDVKVSVDTDCMYNDSIGNIYHTVKDAKEIDDWIKNNNLKGNKSNYKTIMLTPEEYRNHDNKRISELNKKLHKL